MQSSTSKKAFTLIELLVVISIIALITSIVMTSLSSSRAKAQDVAKKAELNSIRSAVIAYKLDNNGKAPIPVTGGYNHLDTGDAFTQGIQRLVDGGYLSKLPSSEGLFYYAQTTDTGEDAVVVGARMVMDPPSTDGDPGTCRPFSNAPAEVAHMTDTINLPDPTGYSFEYVPTVSGPYIPANSICQEFRLWSYVQIDVSPVSGLLLFSPHGTSYQVCNNDDGRQQAILHTWSAASGANGYALDDGNLRLIGNGTSFLDDLNAEATISGEPVSLTNTKYDNPDHFACSLAGNAGYKSCAPCYLAYPTNEEACLAAASYPTLCNNGTDDDGDGDVDLEDAGCATINDDGESPNITSQESICSDAESSDYCLCI